MVDANETTNGPSDMTSSEHRHVVRLLEIGMGLKENPRHTSLPRASILVPIFTRNATPHLLLTQRPTNLSSHPGEVCFPGGRQDPEDGKDDIVTALRETKEEVGIPSHHIQPICRLPTVESKSGLCVTPVVALVDPPCAAEPSALNISKEEVEAAFSVPLSYFMNSCPSSCEEIEWRGQKFIMRYYFFEDSEFHNRTFKIWGLTAHVAYEVAKIALGDDNI